MHEPSPPTADIDAAEDKTAEAGARSSGNAQLAEGRTTESRTRRWPGLLVTAGLAVVATLLARIDLIGQTLHLGPVVLAILLGAALRNTVALPALLQPGIRISVKQVLKAAIILLGFELSIGEVIDIGGAGLTVVCLVVGSTLGAAYFVSRWLGLGRKLGVLIASGCSICGTSAIVAADAVVGAEDEDTAYAVAVVSVLGTIAMFALPLVQAVAALPETVYGVWAGASIHSTGQAVAAGFAVGDEAGRVASLIKLTRVLFIAPVTLGLTLLYARRQRATEDRPTEDRPGKQQAGQTSKIAIPWFVFGFLAVIALNSAAVIPPSVTDMLIHLDTFLLAMAMAAMGLEIRFAEMRQVGLTPLWAGSLATIFISLLALGLALLTF